MTWRFGAVGAETVMAVVSDAKRFSDWIVAVPMAGRIDPKWPYAGAIVRKDTDREPHGRHAYARHLTIAVVETWDPPHEFVLRLRSGLGGWIRLSVRVQPRPGGCLVEVRSDPLTVSARLRYAGADRFRAAERCAAVAENLLRLATELESSAD